MKVNLQTFLIEIMDDYYKKAKILLFELQAYIVRNDLFLDRDNRDRPFENIYFRLYRRVIRT